MSDLNSVKIENDYILLGSYPQSSMIKEPIKWRILKKEDNILTVISDVILFNDDFDINYSDYKNSKIRKIILNEFITSAFTDDELNFILDTKLEDDIIDKVYLPSLDDLKDLSREDRIRKVTNYAYSNKASSYPIYTKKDKKYERNGWYWTRTPYKPPYDPKRSNHVYYISYCGSVEERTVWGYDIGVVLMMRVKYRYE